MKLTPPSLSLKSKTFHFVTTKVGGVHVIQVMIHDRKSCRKKIKKNPCLNKGLYINI